jgi:hypothetical protein
MPMRKVISIALIASYLFWGGFVLYPVVTLFLYNAYFEAFEFVCTEASAFQMNDLTDNRKVAVRYSFSAGGSVYHDKESFFKEILAKSVGNNPGSLVVCYNSKFPKIHYLRGINFKQRTFEMAAALGGFFLLITILVDLFGDKDWWAKKYERAFGR